MCGFSNQKNIQYRAGLKFRGLGFRVGSFRLQGISGLYKPLLGYPPDIYPLAGPLKKSSQGRRVLESPYTQPYTARPVISSNDMMLKEYGAKHSENAFTNPGLAAYQIDHKLQQP